MKKLLSLLLVVMVWCANAQIKPMVDLTKQKWFLWPDTNAHWKNDKLFLPPVNLNELPVNAPTVGWDGLTNTNSIEIDVPATVEQYLWGQNGNKFGIAGNYVGVSWFFTDFMVPEAWKGKRVVIKFESARLRAEVYLNASLAGYHLINGTPFDADISKAAKYGQMNRLAVRITDPNGNFAWRDWETYAWGDYEILPSHGFGGITGNVSVEVTEPSYISDVFIKNKKEIKAIDAVIQLSNREASAKGILSCAIYSLAEPGNVVFAKDIAVENFTGTKTIAIPVNVPKAKNWSPDEPNLYVFKTVWKPDGGEAISFNRRFGFRWFEIKDVAGDRQFYLNNQRIVLRTAISWGHWPENGIFPTDELARKQIITAKQLGLNMLNFHRGIGQTKVMDYADEIGLLYYEEPGGYKPGDTDFAKGFKRNKLNAMVTRDRNHPCMVIYSMVNEAGRDPFENEVADMAEAHRIDETRCITFSSQYYTPKYHDSKAPLGASPGKMFMEPYSHEQKIYGWYDEHHAGGPGVYRDEFYNGPKDFTRYIDHPGEILFWGEEGAIGTPPRLQPVAEAIREQGRTGWDGDTYLNMFTAYKKFLSDKGFSQAFADIDALTTAMGQVAYYYQGRIIENIRIGNLTDGYAVNGWESTKIENHSGIVDVYRNPKADVNLLAHYNQPLYVAVKSRKLVLEPGETALVDFYIVNEKNLKGRYTIAYDITIADGSTQTKSFAVNLAGGATYGQLLKEGVKVLVEKAGYCTINARLLKGKNVEATGFEKLYVVSPEVSRIAEPIAVLDTSGQTQRMLAACGISNVVSINRGGVKPKERVLLVGAEMQPGVFTGNFKDIDPMMDWVAEGNTLIITANADVWCNYLADKEAIDYRGFKTIGTVWFGGNYVARTHPLFSGLPANCALNWEYQALAGYNNKRIGLRIENDECVAAVSADHKPELYSALSVVPFGAGKIVISAFDLSSILKNSNGNAVSKRLLCNYIAYGLNRK